MTEDQLPTPAAAPPAPSDPTAESYHLLGRRLEAEGTRLFKLGLGVLGAAALYFTFTAEVDVPVHLSLGLAILVLALLPFLFWLREGGSRFPVFEAMIALTANTYALPVLTGHSHLQQYPPETITRAALAVLAYQAAALLVYAAIRGRPGRARFWTEPVLNASVERWISHGMLLSAAYQAVVRFTTLVPGELESILRAVFYGIGVLATFVASQRWGRGELRPGEKFAFGAALVVQALIISTGLLLISAVTLCGIGLLGYLSGGRRIPWLGLAAFFLGFAVLHNGKGLMREKYWAEGQPAPGFADLPAFYTEWLRYGLTTPVLDVGAESAGSRLLDRTSLLHILCLVVHYTPERQPHLDGRTYGYVLPQLVPRLLWPDKPRSHIATYELAVYYGLQDEESTARTTIAFGLLAEAYANFGLVGGVLLGAFFGFVFKKLQVLTLHSPMFSLAGILMILLTAWSLNAEHTLAAWVSSLFQALIVALGLPLLLRKVLGP